MSEPRAQPVLGLGDTSYDVDIVTREIDHDFFDNPPTLIGSSAGSSSGQVKGEGSSSHAKADAAFLPKNVLVKATTGKKTDAGMCQDENTKLMPNEEANNTDEYMQSDGEEMPMGKLDEISLHYSSEPDCTNGVRLDKSIRSKHYLEERISNPGNEAEDEENESEHASGRSSNLTVHLEMGKDQELSSSDFYKMQSNATSPTYPRPKQCYQLQQRKKSYGSSKKYSGIPRKSGPLGPFSPMNATECGLTGNFDGMNSSNSSTSSSDESELSDSSNSELDSLDSDDEEFVDMLEKYFDYIEQDSDCSDLTEVSPLSSLAASPLPSSYLFGVEGPNEENADSKLETENLCLAANGLQIHADDMTTSHSQVGSNKDAGIYRGRGAGKDGHWGKPKLPLIISTTETVIIPEPKISMDLGATGDSKEKEQDLCLDCCLESAKKILSREASPCSKENGGAFAAPKPENDDRSASCCSANSSVSIPRGDSSRSSSSAWSTPHTSNGKGGSSSGSGSSSSSFGSGGKRPPKNYTFTPEQMRKIERENHILLRKILDTHKGHHHSRPCHRTGHRSITSSTSVGRMRQQRRIEHENAMLMKRLQTVKPSKEIGEAFKTKRQELGIF